MTHHVPSSASLVECENSILRFQWDDLFPRIQETFVFTLAYLFEIFVEKKFSLQEFVKVKTTANKVCTEGQPFLLNLTLFGL